jgi:hypothetical protein
MQYIFPQFSYVGAVVAIAVSVAIGLVAYFFVFKTSLFDHLVKQPLVMTFVVVPCIVLAMILGFMASSVWQNTETAQSSLQNERLALARLNSLPFGLRSSDEAFKNELTKYVSFVQRIEWGRHYNTKRSTEVDAVIFHLYKMAWSADQTSQATQLSERNISVAILSELINSLKQLESAREQRLMLGKLAKFGYLRQWLLVYILALISAVTIAAIHRNNQQGSVIALAIFCASIATVFSLISTHMHPYRGASAFLPSLLTAP